MEQKHPHMDRMMRVIDYIHAHAGEDLSLDQLADVAAMSRFHWHRVFSAVMGGTPAAVIRSVRMHKASMLLVRSEMPIAKIGESVGYANERSFVRIFKEAYAVTPATFRKRGRTVAGHYPKGGINMNYDVIERQIEGLTLAALAHQGPYSEGSVAYQKVATIMSAGNHWPQTRGMAGIYYDDPNVVPEDQLRCHAGVIWQGATIPEGLEEVALDAGRYAVLQHKGHYSGLANAYQYLYGPWLAETRAELRDAPPFEVYLNSPADTPADELLTEVFLPLKA